jgi:sigma-B regulation protein RsbU (phosphoserine phosphatase)
MKGKIEKFLELPKQTVGSPSLRFKSILFTANLVILIVLVNSAFFLLQERKALRVEKELRAAAILENFAESNREALILKDHITLETAVHRVIRNEDIAYALITTAKKDEYFATTLNNGDQLAEQIKIIPVSSSQSSRQALNWEKETLIDFSRSLVVQDKPLGTFHLGLSDRGINEVLRTARNKTFLISLFLLLIFLSLILFVVTLAIKPIEQITEHARNLGRGHLKTRLNLQRRDEIGELARTLDQMAEEIQVAENNLVEQERMKRELEIARQMQRELLPASLPAIPGISLGCFYHPAYEVSGDFYDLFPLRDGKFGVIVADVAGKGLKGAWIASITRTTLKTILEMEAEKIRSPRELLISLNRLLKRDLERELFVTLAFLVIDPARDEFTLASAGHPDLLHFGPRGVQKIPSRGPALGAIDDQIFAPALEEKKISLKPGEGFFLYTDGLTEARNQTGKEFGLERLTELLAKFAGSGAGEIPDLLIAEVKSFCGPKDFDDDVTMVVIKKHSAESKGHNAKSRTHGTKRIAHRAKNKNNEQ